MMFIRNFIMYFTKRRIPYYLLFIILHANWISCRTSSTTPKPEIDAKIEKITPDDKLSIRTFLRTSFYPDNPELKAMNVTEVHLSHEDYLLNVIDHGYSYGAVAENGTLLGILLMGPGFISRYSPEEIKKEIDDCKISYFRKYLQYSQALMDIGRTLTANADKSIHFEVAATTPKARKRGVMRKLFKHGIDVARKEGFKIATCANANQYIGNLCESLQWRCITCLPLASIEDEHDKVPIFKTPVHPHLYARVNILDL